MTSPDTSFLENRSLLRLMAFRVQIVLAYQIIAVVVGWHIYELTHNALSLGLIGLAEVIPYFICALFAGYAVDHHSRRMFGVFACALVCINGMILFSTTKMQGNPSIYIYSAIALGGLARAFISPTYNALFALFLPREQYARAVGMGSSVFQFALVAGPALGGALVAWTSMGFAYAVSSVLAVNASLTLFFLRAK